MLLNPNKTEAVLFGTRAQRKKIDTSAGIDVAGVKVAFCSTVKLLGVALDEDLSLNRHVTDIVRGCIATIQELSDIRPLIKLSTTRMVAQGVVMSRLERSAVWNYLSKHGTSAGRTEFTCSDRVSSNAVFKRH